MSQITAIKSTLSYHRIDDLINAVPKKLTIEFIKDEVSKLARGYICLSDVYLNNRAKLNLRCDKGHEYQASWSSFRGNNNTPGKRCPHCANVANLTIEFVKAETIRLAPGYQCLSDVYLNNHTGLIFQCNQGHEYPATWNGFKDSANRCPHCSNKAKPTIEFVKTEVSKRAPGYRCVSVKYVNGYTKLDFVCNQGHKYPATWEQFKHNGNRCPECYLQNKRGENAWNYRHDLTEQERAENEDRTYDLRNRQWKKQVFERDRYTCQYCGDDKGGNLNAHHIHNFADHKEIRYNVENGITLCDVCHKEYHKYFGMRNTNQAQLDRWFAAKEKVLEIRKIYGYAFS